MAPCPLWRSKAALASLGLHVGMGAAVGVARGLEPAPRAVAHEVAWWVEAGGAAERGAPAATPEGAPDAESTRSLSALVMPKVRRTASRVPGPARAAAKTEEDRVRAPAPENVAQAPSLGSSLSATTEPTFTRRSGPLSERDVDQPPRLLGRVLPRYPRAALDRGVEADVVLALVVDERGGIGEVRVLHGAGHVFDAAALAAARQLRFAPGVKQGQRVAVRVTWTCRFRLDG